MGLWKSPPGKQPAQERDQQASREERSDDMEVTEGEGVTGVRQDTDTDTATEEVEPAKLPEEKKTIKLAPARLAVTVGPILGKVLAAAELRATGEASHTGDALPSTPQDRKADKRKEAPSPDEDEEEQAEKEKRSKKIIDIDNEIADKIDTIVGKKVNRIKELEVQNTAKEVKVVTSELIRAVERLKRKLIDVVKEKLEEVQAEKTQPVTVTKTCDDCEARKTEQAAKEEQTKKAEQEKADEIKRKISKLESLEELVILAEEKWTRQAYEQTRYSPAGIAGNRKIRVFIQGGGETDPQTKSTLEQLEKLFPAVREINELEDGEVATTSSTLASNLLRKGKHSSTEQKTTLIVGRIPKGATNIDIAEVIDKVSDEVKNLQQGVEDRPLIRIPSDARIETYRKFIEGCWVSNGIAIGADISVKHQKPKNTADHASRPNRQSRKTQEGSLLIKAGNATFADVLKNLRSNIDTNAAGVDIRSVRNTEEGVRIQLREKRRGAQTKLAQFISDELKLSTEVRAPPLSATISIIGMDLVTTEEEIAGAVRKALNPQGDANIRVGPIRDQAGGYRTVLVQMSRNDADKILRANSFRIGWQTCGLKEWYRVPMCYRCQQMGHMAARCTAPETSIRRCYRCGEEGHKGAECKADYTFCTACRASGHSGYTTQCPKYKQILEDILARRTQTELNEGRSREKTETGLNQTQSHPQAPKETEWHRMVAGKKIPVSHQDES